MNLKEFIELIQKFDEKSLEIMGIANIEYANDSNKFSNFDITAAILREINPRLAEMRPEDVALVFLIKHLLTIAKGESLREDMEGRYHDEVNYTKLHYGMWKRRQLGYAPNLSLTGQAVAKQQEVQGEPSLSEKLKAEYLAAKTNYVGHDIVKGRPLVRDLPPASHEQKK
jgi:hypothetical protein